MNDLAFYVGEIAVRLMGYVISSREVQVALGAIVSVFIACAVVAIISSVNVLRSVDGS